jgi:hypothetical protein
LYENLVGGLSDFKKVERNVKALILSVLSEHAVGAEWTLFHGVTVNSQLCGMYGEWSMLVT